MTFITSESGTSEQSYSTAFIILIRINLNMIGNNAVFLDIKQYLELLVPSVGQS